MEKAYLIGDRSLSGVLLALLVTVYLAALAFWRRSVICGSVVDAMMLSKVAWSCYFGGLAGGSAIAAPALVGLVVCNAVVLLAARSGHGKPTA